MGHRPIRFDQNVVGEKVPKVQRTFVTTLDEGKQVDNRCSPSYNCPSGTFAEASILG